MNLANFCYNMVHDTLGSYSDDKSLQWHSLGCAWMGMCNSEWICKLIIIFINNFMEYFIMPFQRNKPRYTTEPHTVH